MAISDYMHYTYVRDARGEDGKTIDCWGLVRLVWERELGKPQLPLFSGVMNPKEFTRYYEDAKSGFTGCEPSHGVIAACFQSRLCTHVGIVLEIDGQLRVLDINENQPVAHHPLRKFCQKFTTVIFYDYKDLP